MTLKNNKPDKTNLNSKTLDVAKTILATLWEIGAITIKAFFPHPYYHTFCEHKNTHTIYSSINRLKNKGLIKKHGDTFRLTKKGEEEAFFAHLEAQKILYKPKKQKWDGNWRMVIFDVPEQRRWLRDYLRSFLKVVGFKELQKSVWVTPYKIPRFLKELLWEEKIKPYTRFITIKEIDYDKDLRNMFKLN